MTSTPVRSLPSTPPRAGASSGKKSAAALKDPTDYILVFKADDEVHQGHQGALVDLLRHEGFGVSRTRSSDAKTVFVKIKAPFDKLMRTAERVHMQKRLKLGGVSDFAVANCERFEGIEDPPTFFTTTERTSLVWDAIAGLRSRRGRDMGGTVEHGRPIVSQCLSEGSVQSAFPLHKSREKAALDKTWVHRPLLAAQPIDEVRNYFGEKIALYFAWLDFYTHWLVFPTVAGVALAVYQYLTTLDNLGVPLFSVAISLWSVCFLEYWKRENARLAYRWHTLDYEVTETERPEFYGTLVDNPITGDKEYVYSPLKRNLKFLVSIPVLGALFLLSFASMFASFWLAERVQREHWAIQYLPTVAYSALVPALNSIFQRVASWFNSWENYRTESQHDNNLIWKVVLFDFVNSYASLFYTAFWKCDLQQLQKQMAALLVTRQILDNVRETLLPWLVSRFRQRRLRTGGGTDVDGTGSGKIPKIEAESMLQEYSSTNEDYLEMVLQFGYVTFFAPAFPLAALAALLNNVMEVRSDAFKLVHTCRRPRPVKAANIGTWFNVMELMATVAVMTNCTFLILTSSVFNQHFPSADLATEIAVFVAIEHIVLGVRFAIATIIDDIPPDVRDCLKRDRKERELALQESLVAAGHATPRVNDFVLAPSPTSTSTTTTTSPSSDPSLNSSMLPPGFKLATPSGNGMRRRG